MEGVTRRMQSGWHQGVFAWSIAVGLLLAGCSVQSRHTVLTFFFTGVPPLEVQEKEAPPVGARQPAGQRQLPLSGSPAQRSQTGGKAVPVVIRYYSHRPWLQGECIACHGGNNQFLFQQGKGGGTPEGERVFYTGGGMPGPLCGAKERLCLGCHADKTAIRAIKERLWLHNPVAKGDCLACHDPHQSRISGILRKPADQLCRSCHSPEAIGALIPHPRGPEPCLSCHNPHLGKGRSLLISEYRETASPVAERR